MQPCCEHCTRQRNSNSSGHDEEASQRRRRYIAQALPLGYNHMLCRWFSDGAELSVGEWQRIALARAFLRGAPVLILDDRTSAMDPGPKPPGLNDSVTFPPVAPPS